MLSTWRAQGKLFLSVSHPDHEFIYCSIPACVWLLTEASAHTRERVAQSCGKLIMDLTRRLSIRLGNE